MAPAQWFDAHFQPLEPRYTYARPSRCQSAAPDIPRPSWYIPQALQAGRLYGVVLDTSGSMDRRTGKHRQLQCSSKRWLCAGHFLRYPPL
ncbi:MAG: hypothetical protein HFE97_11515 [Oscillospiraceae bacterium]|nr:hypothetical protein [Oscillospiraceae bacterium]